MFDIGFWELLIIGIVALLVIGPERLPAVARQAGRWVGQMQRFVRNAKDDIQRELEAENLKSMLDDQEKQIHELRSMMEDKQSGSGLSALSEQLNQSAEEINRSFKDSPPARSITAKADEALGEAAAQPAAAPADTPTAGSKAKSVESGRQSPAHDEST